MPVHACQEDGKKGWKWGGHGKCYTYTDEEGSKRAHAKAEAQGRAARASGWQGKGEGGEEMEEENCPECDMKALPDVKPNEDEQTYVSRCIAFETEHSPDRDPKQVQRMCYEKYRAATGGKTPSGVKSIDELSSELLELKKELEEIKKGLI